MPEKPMESAVPAEPGDGFGKLPYEPPIIEPLGRMEELTGSQAPPGSCDI